MIKISLPETYLLTNVPVSVSIWREGGGSQVPLRKLTVTDMLFAFGYIERCVWVGSISNGERGGGGIVDNFKGGNI